MACHHFPHSFILSLGVESQQVGVLAVGSRQRLHPSRHLFCKRNQWSGRADWNCRSGKLRFPPLTGRTRVSFACAAETGWGARSRQSPTLAPIQTSVLSEKSMVGTGRFELPIREAALPTPRRPDSCLLRMRSGDRLGCSRSAVANACTHPGICFVREINGRDGQI